MFVGIDFIMTFFFLSVINFPCSVLFLRFTPAFHYLKMVNRLKMVLCLKMFMKFQSFLEFWFQYEKAEILKSASNHLKCPHVIKNSPTYLYLEFQSHVISIFFLNF